LWSSWSTKIRYGLFVSGLVYLEEELARVSPPEHFCFKMDLVHLEESKITL